MGGRTVPMEQVRLWSPIQETMEKDKSLSTQDLVKTLSTLQVKDFASFIPALLTFFRLEVTEFKAGRLPSYVKKWKLLTSDEFNLDMVSEAHIEFSSPPVQTK